MSSRILIVDDDASFCAALARALTRRGWDTGLAHTPQAALEQARARSPTHIVLDLNLGGHSGLILLPQLKACAPDALILLLTGYASIATAVEAIKLGAINYLAKPADADSILAAFSTHAAPTPAAEPTPMSLRRLQWEHVQRVLNENDGNISAAARQLGLHRRTLQRQLQKRPVKR